MRHLLRIPEDFKIEDEPEDEFECLNLDICAPASPSSKGPLPVLVWIHGASSVMNLLLMKKLIIVFYRWFSGCNILLCCIEDLR